MPGRSERRGRSRTPRPAPPQPPENESDQESIVTEEHDEQRPDQSVLFAFFFEPANTDNPPGDYPTLRNSLSRLSRRHRLFYLVYIFPLLAFNLGWACVLAVPWFLPIKSFKPKLLKEVLWRKEDKTSFEQESCEAASYSAHDVDREEIRNIFAPITMGGWAPIKQEVEYIEGKKTKTTTKIEGFRWARYYARSRRTWWRGWWMRVWDMYTLLRDIVHTFSKQGLQVMGVFCGVVLFLMQLTMMAYELSGGQIQRYTDAATSGKETDFLKGDGHCGYIAGTAIANWSGTWLSFVWYAAYHTALAIMCLLLIADEVLNAPMGLVGPTNSRAGTGYTIIFLAFSTLNTSSNWGWKRMIPFHRSLLIAIATIGLYNVLRLLLAAMDCTADHTVGTSNVRAGRTALRPWKEQEWIVAQSYMKRHERPDPAALKNLEDEGLASFRLTSLQSLSYNLHADSEYMDKRYGPEATFSRAVTALLAKDEAAEMVKELTEEGTKSVQTLKNLNLISETTRGEIEKKIQKVRQNQNKWQKKWSDGSRRFIYGFPFSYAPPTMEEHLMHPPPSETMYLAAEYPLDRCLVYGGARPIVVRILERYWLLQKGDVLVQTDAEYNATGALAAKLEERYRAGLLPAQEEDTHRTNGIDRNWPEDVMSLGVSRDVRWESLKEFDERASRDRKEGDPFEGIHDWTPPDLYYRTKAEHFRQKKSRKATYIVLDMRRGLALLVGVWLMLVHIANLFYNVGTSTNNWPTYRAQFETVAETWTQNGGPDDDSCQYFQGSNLPIWVRPGEGRIKGVFSIMFIFIVWEVFIIHFALSVVLVILSNCRAWGDLIAWPLSLLGPRLTTVSVGWTIGFLGCATLQMGLFPYQPALAGFAQGGGYLAVLTWATYLFVNEPLLYDVARRPWWGFLSKIGVQRMIKSYEPDKHLVGRKDSTSAENVEGETQ